MTPATRTALTEARQLAQAIVDRGPVDGIEASELERGDVTDSALAAVRDAGLIVAKLDALLDGGADKTQPRPDLCARMNAAMSKTGGAVLLTASTDVSPRWCSVINESGLYVAIVGREGWPARVRIEVHAGAHRDGRGGGGETMKEPIAVAIQDRIRDCDPRVTYARILTVINLDGEHVRATDGTRTLTIRRSRIHDKPDKRSGFYLLGSSPTGGR